MYDLIEAGGLPAGAGVTGLATPLADGLERPDLLRDRAYVGGAWCDAGDGRRLAVTDPADGSLIGTVPDIGGREALRAVEAAARAFPAWRATPAGERGAILRRWAGLMLRHEED